MFLSAAALLLSGVMVAQSYGWHPDDENFAAIRRVRITPVSTSAANKMYIFFFFMPPIYTSGTQIANKRL